MAYEKVTSAAGELTIRHCILISVFMDTSANWRWWIAMLPDNAPSARHPLCLFAPCCCAKRSAAPAALILAALLPRVSLSHGPARIAARPGNESWG